MTDLTEVLLTEGKVMQQDIVLGLSELSYRFGDFRIVGEPRASLTVENLGGQKLSVRGTAQITVSIPCARCLEPVETELEIPFELETSADDRDYIDGYNLNVDQLVHDEALLVWPERVLCRPDCQGLCSVCGQNLNEGSCGCERTDLDPEMAKILDIFSKFKEV